MQISAVAYDDLDDIWPFIEHGIEVIIDIHEEKGVSERTYVPMETYEHLKLGRSLLMLCLDDYEVLKGFFLIKILIIEDKRVLVPHTVFLKGVIPIMPFIDKVLKELAEKYNCEEINMHTTDTGWADILKPLGYKSSKHITNDGFDLVLIRYKLRK